jgi:hypothetical protein
LQIFLTEARTFMTHSRESPAAFAQSIAKFSYPD